MSNAHCKDQDDDDKMERLSSSFQHHRDDNDDSKTTTTSIRTCVTVADGSDFSTRRRRREWKGRTVKHTKENGVVVQPRNHTSSRRHKKRAITVLSCYRERLGVVLVSVLLLVQGMVLCVILVLEVPSHSTPMTSVHRVTRHEQTKQQGSVHPPHSLVSETNNYNQKNPNIRGHQQSHQRQQKVHSNHDSIQNKKTDGHTAIEFGPTTTKSPPSLLSSLRYPLDYEQYTVRVNTWKRPQQLYLVLSHLITCPAVAQVQVVWCSAQGPVPTWLQDWIQSIPPRDYHDETWSNSWPRIVVEYHDDDSSLNARFDIRLQPPTVGILNHDDDVARPCAAMNAGFALWTLNPSRLVGYDARRIGTRGLENKDKEDDHTAMASHGESFTANDKNPSKLVWSYGALSQAQKWNDYALTLTRFAFCHSDYLHSYSNDMPASMRHFVAQHLNCEDVALSFWISHLTKGQLPLLADGWAVSTLVKLPTDQAISLNTAEKNKTDEGGTHKQLRNTCVDEFSTLLGLKTHFQSFSSMERVKHYPNAEWRHTVATHSKSNKNHKNKKAHSEYSLLQAGVPGNELLLSNTTATDRMLGSHAHTLLQQRREWKTWTANEITRTTIQPAMAQIVNHWKHAAATRPKTNQKPGQRPS